MPRPAPNGENITEDEAEEIVLVLRNIQGCDLSAWDQDFIDDMLSKMDRYGTSARFTGRQWEQIERLKEQFL